MTTLEPTLLGDTAAIIFDTDKIVSINSSDTIGSGDTRFIPDFLSDIDASNAFKQIEKEVNFQQWHHMPDKNYNLLPLSRLKIALADIEDEGWQPYYRFPVNNQSHHQIFYISDFPSIKSILEKLIKETGINFNHIVILLYRDGNDCIGFHKDKTLDLSLTDPIASISLGQKRDYILRDDIRNPIISQKLELNNGSLLLLGSKTNTEWYHSIPIVKSESMNARISITFRVVTTFRNIKTGDIKGQGGYYKTFNWPEQLKGMHIQYPSELLNFWFDKDKYLGGD